MCKPADDVTVCFISWCVSRISTPSHMQPGPARAGSPKVGRVLDQYVGSLQVSLYRLKSASSHHTLPAHSPSDNASCTRGPGFFRVGPWDHNAPNSHAVSVNTQHLTRTKSCTWPFLFGTTISPNPNHIHAPLSFRCALIS